MTNVGKTIAVVVGLVILAVAFFVGRASVIIPNPAQNLLAGSIGTNPIENYIPAILYNEGYYSALPIQTTSTVTSAGMINTGTFTLGSATGGTAVTKFVAPANCTIIANADTIAATSTKDVDCAVTGLRSGDTVLYDATTTMSTTFLGVKVLAARASTTDDYATLTLVNETGTTFTWTGAASTSIKIFGVR